MPTTSKPASAKASASGSPAYPSPTIPMRACRVAIFSAKVSAAGSVLTPRAYELGGEANGLVGEHRAIGVEAGQPDRADAAGRGGGADLEDVAPGALVERERRARVLGADDRDRPCLRGGELSFLHYREDRHGRRRT